jgi:hypothetical protein
MELMSMKPKFTGSNRMESESVIGRSSSVSGKPLWPRTYPFLAICVQNDGNEASLELGKAYQIIRPLQKDPPNRLRVIDEEGEDYIYPADWFVPVRLTSDAKRRLMAVIEN